MNELDMALETYTEACKKSSQADDELEEIKRMFLAIELRVNYGVKIGDSIEWTEPAGIKMSWEKPPVIVPAKICRGKLLSYGGGAITVLVYKRNCTLSSRERRIWITGRPELNIKKIEV